VKQWGLGQSNYKEYWHKGDEQKENKAVTKRGVAGAVQRKRSGAEWSIGGVDGLTDSALSWWQLQRLSGGFDGQVVQRPHCSELSLRLEPSRCSERPLRRFHSSASFWGPMSSLEARAVVVGARSVTRPLAGDNCAVRAHCHELHRLYRCLTTTAHGRYVSPLVISWKKCTQHWVGYCQRVHSARAKQASAAHVSRLVR